MDYVLLGNEGLKVAFQAAKNPPLEILSLAKNDLSYKSISGFLSSISNVPLLSLDLSKNNLANEGLKVLTDIFGISYGRTPLSINLSLLNIASNSINSIAF